MGLSCLACELTRARLKAAALALVGWTYEEIAVKLSNDYGENYYVHVYHGAKSDVWQIERLNKLPQHEPYIIAKKESKK